MAIISKITVGGKLVLEVNADPSVNATPAPIGSKALFNDAGVGKEYLKVSASDTSWQMVVSGAIDLSPYLKKDGSVALEGSLLPSGQNTINLGSEALHYNSFYLRSLEIMSAGVGRGSLRYNGTALLLSSTSSNVKISPSTQIVDMTASRIINVQDPTSAQDASTKKYVDDADALLIPLAQKGAVNGVAPLDGAQKIPNIYLPALAITDTFVVASQVAMLALGGSGAEKGDVAVRTDLNKSFILAGTDPSVLADWQELLTPTDTVLSVNGQIGAVVLTTTDIAEGTNLYFTAPRAVSAALASEKLWIAGDSLAELNVAVATKYFGTKTGDFNIEFHRNSVKMLDFQSDKIVMGKDIQLGGAGAEYIRSSSNLYVTSTSGMYLTTPNQFRVSAGYMMERLGEGAVSSTLTRYTDGFLKTPASATLSDTFVAMGAMQSRNIHVEAECFVSALNGAVKCNMFKKVNIHIDSNNTIVIVQDTFTSKNAGAVNFDVTFEIISNQLIANFNFGADSGAFTAKEMKMRFTRLQAE